MYMNSAMVAAGACTYSTQGSTHSETKSRIVVFWEPRRRPTKRSLARSFLFSALPLALLLYVLRIFYMILKHMGRLRLESKEEREGGLG